MAKTGQNEANDGNWVKKSDNIRTKLRQNEARNSDEYLVTIVSEIRKKSGTHSGKMVREGDKYCLKNSV